MKMLRALACLALLCSVACGSKSNPGGPSPSSPAVPRITISNLRAVPLGLKRTLCVPDSFYIAIDELSFDFDATGGELSGAKIVNRSDENVSVSLGDPIAQCSLSAGPCADFGHACIVTGSAAHGTVRAYAGVNWQPSTTWRLSVTSNVARSNELTARIDRSENLPYGDRSGIVELRIIKCVTTQPTPAGGCYVAPDLVRGDVYYVSMSTYNPRKAGRTIQERLEVTNPQTHITLTSQATDSETQANSMTIGLGAQIVTSNNTHPSPPFVITGTIHEVQGTTPIADDTKQISYP